MSEKRVKAWAVVPKNGKPTQFAGGLLIFYRKADAKEMHEFGERVVPVTIIVEEK